MEGNIESVWIGYDIFKETGDLHMVQAVFEQDGVPTEVSFSKNEPEYEWARTSPTRHLPNKATGSLHRKRFAKDRRRLHPVVITVGVVALIGTFLLLGKVRRISRGGFRIPYRE